MKVLYTLVMLVSLAIVGLPQSVEKLEWKLNTPSDTSLSTSSNISRAVALANGYKGFVAGGIEYAYGEFGFRNGPELGSAHALGVFGEAARDVYSGQVIVAPRGLLSVRRNYPSIGKDFTEYNVRPEVEVRVPLARGLQPVVAGGLNYTTPHSGEGVLNPIAGVGLQYHDYRATYYRFFQDNDRGNARGNLYRFDYLRKFQPLGLRVSAEIFSGYSEYKYIRYSGTVFTARVGVVK